MKHLWQRIVLVIATLVISTPATASFDVEQMSDIEVSEYAVRMSTVLEKIQDNQLCVTNDIECVREECARHGVSYDDKAAVQKRILLIIAKIY